MWTAVTIASAPRMVEPAPKGFAWPLPHVRGAPRSQEILGFTRTGATSASAASLAHFAQRVRGTNGCLARTG